MTVIAMPTDGVRGISWTMPAHQALVIKSQWTQTSAIADLGTADGWKAQVEVAPGGYARLLVWRAWLAAMKGRVNTTELDPADGRQAGAPFAADIVGTIGAVAAGATSMPTTAAASVLNLPAGSLIAVGGRVFTLTADMIGDGAGHATMSFQPPLPFALADSTAIKVKYPKAAMRLAANTLGWTDETSVIFRPGGFTLEEAI